MLITNTLLILHNTLKFYQNSNENILIYNIPYKIILGARPLCIRFDKIDGFIKIYNGTRYLVLFAPRICDTIYDKIRDLIIDKNGIRFSISHDFGKISIDLCNSLRKEKNIDFL